MRLVSKESFSERQKYTRLLAKIGLGALALVFLLLPGVLREGGLAIGDKVFYHLSLAGEFVGTGYGWNFLLGYVPMETLLAVSGLLSVGLFFSNFKELEFEERLVAVTLFIISPAFIYLFNVGERFAMAFLFSLVAGHFFVREKYLYGLMSALLIFLFDFWIGIFVLFFSLLYFLYTHKRNKALYILTGGFLVFILFFRDFNKGVISDLGAWIGTSIFALLFILFCFLLFWNKHKFLAYYGVAILLFLFAWKVDFGIFYFGAFLSVLMSLCLFELLRMKWESKLVRDLILLIVVCGLLFSGLSYMNRISIEKPTVEIFELLEEIPEGSVVFSDVDYGNWITFSGKRNVWDSFKSFEELEKIKEDFSVLFEDGSYVETVEVLQMYEVDYILVDAELRGRWQESSLFYLLRYNNEDFRLVYENEYGEIWSFL
jgi:hypothetical protein